MVDSESTISRRDFSRGILAGGLTVFASVLEAGHARAVIVWNQTVNQSPLGDKFKQDLQSLSLLRENYNKSDTPYNERLKISNDYDTQEKLVTEMADDIARTVDSSNGNSFPHFKWWESNSPAYVGLGLGIVGISGLISSLKERISSREHPQEPQII